MNVLQRMYMAMGRWLKLIPESYAATTAQARIWSQTEAFDRYRILRAYYDNNDLYALVQTALEERAGVKHPLQGLRNPTHQVVEFYVTNLWRGRLPESLPIITANTPIIEPIHQVWAWSNWSTKKQQAARWLARDGDLFVKVAQNEAGDRVFYQLIDAMHMTDFDKDNRDNLIFARLDIPQVVVTDGNQTKVKWLTEVWEKDGNFRQWEHDKGREVELDKLPDPQVNESLESRFGIDFLPFVHTPFIAGEKRGKAAIEAALDKVDEVNRKATRLSKQQFRHNDVTWALESNLTDAQNRPLPPPAFETTSGEDIVEVGGERMLKPPSGWHLTPMVPQLDYNAALAVLVDDMHELERDLPEMTWFRLRDQELSGRAIRLKLGEAIARAEEVQGNMLDGLARLNAMALTIGQIAGIEGFDAATIGTFDEGKFDHTFTPPEIIPIPGAEKAETLATLVTAGIPVPTAMRMLKYPDDQIADVEADLAAQRAQQEQQRAQATLQALRDLQMQEQTTAVDQQPTEGEAA